MPHHQNDGEPHTYQFSKDTHANSGIYRLEVLARMDPGLKNMQPWH
jgi:hypothetical protein